MPPPEWCPPGSDCRHGCGFVLGRSRGYFSTLRAAPQAPWCRRGPRRVPFVTLSRALLCQHGVGKWLCLTRTCWVCDLAGLAAACASPKQQQSSPLPGTALPSPAAPSRWCGESRAHHCQASSACREQKTSSGCCPPHVLPTARCALCRAHHAHGGCPDPCQVQPLPPDILSFICASRGKF